MFMHGIEEFDVFRGDTLANPGFMEYDELKKEIKNNVDSR